MSDEEALSPDSKIPFVGRIVGLVLFVGILLLPTPDGMKAEAQRLMAVTALVSTFWLTQAMPLAASSMLPLVLFPILGIQGAEVVSHAYINKEVFLFLGGFMIALGLERWGLHERIALHILRVLGTSPRRVLLGFLIATAFLSMWISNTATALMMVPIGMALVRSWQDIVMREPSTLGGSDRSKTQIRFFGANLVLGIAWAASIGGLMTLVGTVTNVQFQSLWQKLYPHAPRLSAGEWFSAFGPVGVALLLAAWGVLCWGLPKLDDAQLDRSFFSDRLKRLGPPTRAQWQMAVVFVMTAGLWTFRTPLKFGSEPLSPGWEAAMQSFLVNVMGTTTAYAKTAVHDSTVAIGMALLMFLMPTGRNEHGHTQFMMDWPTASKLPWSLVLLIGGGFAIADGLDSSGLAQWASGTFAHVVAGWPLWGVILALAVLSTFFTEFATNVVLVSVMVPVLAPVAVQLHQDPRLLLLPTTIAASFGFMLPIGTPPNAIAFGTGLVPMGHMAKCGALLNLIACVVLTLATVVYLLPLLGIEPGVVPDWASSSVKD